VLEFLRTGWARGQGKVPLWLVHRACSASAAAPWNQTAAEGGLFLPGCARCLEGGVVVSQIRLMAWTWWMGTGWKQREPSIPKIFCTAATQLQSVACSGKGCATLSLNLPLIAASSARVLTFARMKCLDGSKRLTQSCWASAKGESTGRHGDSLLCPAWGHASSMGLRRQRVGDGPAPMQCCVSHRHSWRCFGCSSAVDPSSEGSSGFSLRERDLLTHRCVPMVAESRGVGSELFNTRRLVWVRKAACSSAQLSSAVLCGWKQGFVPGCALVVEAKRGIVWHAGGLCPGVNQEEYKGIDWSTQVHPTE